MSGENPSQSRPVRGYGVDVSTSDQLAGAEPAGASAAAGAQTGGRRERRRREIRDRLYETAIQLFLEQGYERTTMDEIASRADVARTTVFNHYPRKFEFLTEWGDRRREQVADALRRGHLDDSAIDVLLISYMRLMSQLNVDHRAETKELMPASIAFSLSNSPLASAFASYIRLAQERDEIRRDVDPEQAGEMLAASYFATLIRWADHDPPTFDLTEALTSSARLLMQGIGTARGADRDQ
jgi:AcrR family transcriptional regulator